MKKLGVITTIDSNHGSSIFNNALNGILRQAVPEFQILFLRYLGLRRYAYELLRCAKPNSNIPWYNARRYRRIIDFEYRNLDVAEFPKYCYTYERLVRKLHGQRYDALIVAKVLWDFSSTWFVPRFPNIYWLSDTIPAVKIAYAISGHRTDFSLFRAHILAVRKILSTYALIGVRDDITMQMMKEARVDTLVPVCKVPDPAFMFQSSANDTSRDILIRLGVPCDKPIVGLLLYGKQKWSEMIARHYRANGYTVINYNMFNPKADYNIGHCIDPFEWAELFKCLSFCITDRFHCSVLCLKNAVPFIAVEPFKPATLMQSKIHDLLNDFNLLDLYYDVYDDRSTVDELLERCHAVANDWQGTYKRRVEKKCEDVKSTHRAFLTAVQKAVRAG